jgi:thioredoxin reductase
MTSKAVDCLIIGGSHAGLSAALTLYRAQHTCIILDNQSPRNSYSTPVHLVSTWEHKNTESIKNHTREELQATNFVTFVNAAVAKIEKTADGFFQAFDKQGESWLGRTVLLSTGSKDIFPDIKGYDQLYAKRM